MGLSDNERKERLVRYLNREYDKFAAKVGARAASVENFSAYTGVASVSMGQYMNGKRTPSYRNLVRLAKTLGPEIYEVLDVKPEEEVDQDESYLISWWRNASPKQRAGLLKAAAKLRGQEANN